MCCHRQWRPSSGPVVGHRHFSVGSWSDGYQFLGDKERRRRLHRRRSSVCLRYVFNRWSGSPRASSSPSAASWYASARPCACAAAWICPSVLDSAERRSSISEATRHASAFVAATATANPRFRTTVWTFRLSRRCPVGAGPLVLRLISRTLPHIIRPLPQKSLVRTGRCALDTMSRPLLPGLYCRIYGPPLYSRCQRGRRALSPQESFPQLLALGSASVAFGLPPSAPAQPQRAGLAHAVVLGQPPDVPRGRGRKVRHRRAAPAVRWSDSGPTGHGPLPPDSGGDRRGSAQLTAFLPWPIGRRSWERHERSVRPL